MRVLATGPESSGTNALARLLEAGGAEAVHRSQPEGPDWLDLPAMLKDFDAAVVVIRGRQGHLASYRRRGMASTHHEAEARRRRSLAGVAAVLGHHKVEVVTYESMQDPAERRALLEALGLDPAAAEDEEWTDENRKYGE